jgi:esterase/lipase
MTLLTNNSNQDKATAKQVEQSAGTPAAMLLHGLAGSPAEMHYLARSLRQAGFEVHVPAIPGYGFGTRTNPFDTGTWEQWVAYVSGALDILSQAYRLIDSVRRDIGRVTTPSLVLHSIDDDVASTRSAEFVARNIGTREVRTILYRDSYHILTMDNDKDAVAQETIGFCRRHGAETAPGKHAHEHAELQFPAAPEAFTPDMNRMPGFARPQAPRPEANTLMPGFAPA